MIAIPNMDMPKSCWECRLMDGEANCLVTDEGIPFKQEEIHPDCPLIDIVQCGECTEWHEYARQNKGRCDCWLITSGVDDFCSYGERRTDDNSTMDNSNMPTD